MRGRGRKGEENNFNYLSVVFLLLLEKAILS